MNPKLTTKDEALVNLAKKGGGDAELMLLDMLHSLQDEVAALKEQLSKDPPEDVKVEKVSMKLAAKLATLEKGNDGKDGKDGYTASDAELLALIKPLIPELKDGKTPTKDELLALIRPLIPIVKDGETPSDERLLALITPLIPPAPKDGVDGKDGSPDMADDIRNKLELLTGDERLDKSAVKGIEQIDSSIKELRARPAAAGRSLLQLYVNGAKKGAVQYLNITGTGVSYASASGRNDVTITGGGGGGSLSVLTATGTVNDSNLTFTFVSTPTLVNVNGATYTDGHGVSISGSTATLDAAPGVGGFVYGLG